MSTITFGELTSTWLDQVARVTLKKSGFKSYEAMCRLHLVPAFGDKLIDAITSSEVQGYVADRVRSGSSERTVSNERHVMKRLMAYAVERGFVEANPVTPVASPRQEPAATRVRYLQPDQLRQLLAATPPAWRILIAMACMTGLRKGEQLALRFSDIDFDKRTISVTKTIKQGRVTSPKMPWSIGVVPLPESLVPMLEERRHKAPDPDGLIFCRRDGSPLPDSLPNRVLAKALEAAGLPAVSWHEAGRHSWVTAHLQAGTDIPTLTRLGRWKSADVLLSVYAHVVPTAGKEAVRRLDDLVSITH